MTLISSVCVPSTPPNSGQSCTTCTNVYKDTAVLKKQNSVGWTAGANSIAEHDGWIHTVYQIKEGSSGACVGFRSDRKQPQNPAFIEHGFMFMLTGSVYSIVVIESGLQSGGWTVMVSDTFEIRRIDTRVFYFLNNTVIYTSLVPSFGTKLVTGALYVTGDVIL